MHKLYQELKRMLKSQINWRAAATVEYVLVVAAPQSRLSLAVVAVATGTSLVSGGLTVRDQAATLISGGSPTLKRRG